MSGAERPTFGELAIHRIREPELPSRSAMDDEKLNELTADIRHRGLLQPIIVAMVGEEAEVIAGHRRRIACGRAGLVVVPCLIYSSKTAALEGVKYAENRFREELSAADEAIYFSEVLERDCAGDVDTLCAVMNEKRSYVEGRLNLFAGDPEVFKALQADRIQIGVAQQLNKCSDQDIRRSFLRNAMIGGATVAIVAGWISEWKKVHDLTPSGAAAIPAAESPLPVPQNDVFRCEICGENNHPHTLRYMPVHGHCDLAILQPLLRTYRGEDMQDGTGQDPRRG